MRDPINLKEVIYKSDDTEVIMIKSIPEYSYQDYDFMNDKDMKTYFTDLERVVRTSFEYSQMVQYLRNNMNMNQCSFYENVSNLESTKIRIEIHHDPFSLYDICQTVYNKRVYYHEDLDIEATAKEVMWLHYKTMIGLIPLSETVHELVHNSYLLIPISKVFGNVDLFIENYKPFMDPMVLDSLNNILMMSDTYDEMVNTKVLNKHYIYLDVTGAYQLPEYAEIADELQHQISDMKGNIQVPKTLITFGNIIPDNGIGINTFKQEEV